MVEAPAPVKKKVVKKKIIKKVVKKKAPVAEADAAPATEGAGDLPPRMKPAEGGDEA